MATKRHRHLRYENNPFFVAVNGIVLLFDLARGVAVLLLAISLIGLFSGNFSPDTTNTDNLLRLMYTWSFGDWLLAIGAGATIALAIAMIAALLGGVSSYASARMAAGKEVKLGTAFHVAFEQLWSYLWLQVIIFAKLVLWTLLFIIPGVVMSIRYSLAGVAFYDDRKHLRGNAAIKESVRLTRGAWITTFSSNILFNLLTFGALYSVVTTAVNATLYRQYHEAGDKKPNAHWLSWATLIVSLVSVILALYDLR